MPITINGNGTITGVSVGGLPDAIVDADMIAADAVTAAKIAADAVTAAKIGSKTFVSYAAICDSKGYQDNGGTFTAGALRTRDLNTEITDVDSIVSISSNQFTLGAGNYLIKWSAPAFKVNRNIAILKNITDSTSDGTGSAEYSSGTDFVTTRSVGSTRVSLTGSKVYEIQHQSQSSFSSQGFGVSGNISGLNSIYTIVEIYKEA